MVSTFVSVERRNASQRPARLVAKISSTRGWFLSAGAVEIIFGFVPVTAATSAAKSRAAIFTTSGASGGSTMGAATPATTSGKAGGSADVPSARSGHTETGAATTIPGSTAASRLTAASELKMFFLKCGTNEKFAELFDCAKPGLDKLCANVTQAKPDFSTMPICAGYFGCNQRAAGVVSWRHPTP